MSNIVNRNFNNFILRIPKKRAKKNVSSYFIEYPINTMSFNSSTNHLLLWADPILEKDTKLSCIENITIKELIKTVFGHYYYVLYSKREDTICIGNSLFSILPIYYYQDSSNIYLSDKPLKLLRFMSRPRVNKRFILENILFNYPLFNLSCIEGIELLPSNSYILIKDKKTTLVRHTAVEDFFTSNPKPWEKEMDNLSDLFIEVSKKYYPDESFLTSLTGGFDGRTLTSCGLYHNKKFSTYCFGAKKSKDIKFAELLSNRIGLNYYEIDLNEKYIKDYSLPNGLEFITNSSGNASFSRAHYLYTAKILAKNTRYAITGNFGSEVFRAAHIAGVLISQNLYSVFKAENFDKAISAIESSLEFKWVNKSFFCKEWEALIDDIRTLPCFKKEYSKVSKNEQFYKLVFEEILRKYFGAEMVNQYNHIINRTPFLDIIFLKEIFKTKAAGVYSSFFTHNPAKRFKGQILYANIIKKTYPVFSDLKTDKGYKPDDLMSLKGKAKITTSFIIKRMKRKIEKDGDPYAVRASFNRNRTNWDNLVIDKNLFDHKIISSSLKSYSTSFDSLLIALSQVWWNQEVKKLL